MRIHSDDKIKKLIELRKKGYSINELVKKLSIPKTTIWHHIHDIQLPAGDILRLRSAGGRMSKIRREQAIEKAKKEATMIMNTKKKYLVSLLAMLYWAEGDNKNSFSFTNTNHKIIKIFIYVLNNCFGVEKNKIIVTVRYFTGMDKNRCLSFWSKVTKIPKKNIKTYYNDGGNRGRTEFGICRIGVRKSGYLFKLVRSIIENISNNLPS